MNRHSHLIYNESRTDLHQSQSTDGDVFFRSEDGVPLAWFFAFGGRNIWNPGDNVAARGGVVGRRNPYETQIEVALVRLEQAESALQSDEYLWPFVTPMVLFRRKLMSRPKQAFIRVAAPWVIGLEDQQIERWRSATAFAENCVNLVSAGRSTEGLRSLAELRPFSPFVPEGHSGDLMALSDSPHFRSEEEAVKLALLMLGVPDSRENFEIVARKEVAGALAAYRQLPAKVAPAPIAAKAGKGEDLKPTTASRALLDKIGSLFGRKS